MLYRTVQSVVVSPRTTVLREGWRHSKFQDDLFPVDERPLFMQVWQCIHKDVPGRGMKKIKWKKTKLKICMRMHRYRDLNEPRETPMGGGVAIPTQLWLNAPPIPIHLLVTHFGYTVDIFLKEKKKGWGEREIEGLIVSKHVHNNAMEPRLGAKHIHLHALACTFVAACMPERMFG